MAKNYILIDYENVKAIDLGPIVDKPYHLMVFVGASQHKISTDFAMQVQNLKAAEYVRISGNGHNALDFHIAYMIGRLAEREPDASFHIVSKDRGFDPLITYLKASNIKASRVGDLFEIRALRLPKAVGDDGIIDDVVRNLAGRGSSKPRKLRTLASTIGSLFKDGLSDDEVQSVIARLQAKGHIVVDQEKVSYNLRKRR
ncbi:MAG: PIN domain-containing protein [Gammaproteobacteria bacterium]|nr:PIN domain-containing protein [Gammaproteobacteria bacterium]MDE0444191.1 PIN domain-containing protein [Gammaproteobacteria bacterium]